MKLMREVRAFLVKGGTDRPIVNAWAGWPASDRLEPYVTIRIEVEGDVAPDTGFLCNIKRIDAHVRAVLVPALIELTSTGTPVPACLVRLIDVMRGAPDAWPDNVRLNRVELATCPRTRYAARMENHAMVHMTHSFEFSASHRLFSPDLSDEENSRVFGKCANPNGHGHNYVLEVTLVGKVDGTTGTIVDLHTFDTTVRREVIDRFDHKNLNLDCAEFANLNPTVENIARVIHERLTGRFDPAKLHSIRVWETPKTCAEYTTQTPDR